MGITTRIQMRADRRTSDVSDLLLCRPTQSFAQTHVSLGPTIRCVKPRRTHASSFWNLCTNP